MEKKYITVTLKIGGMTCTGCESRIERALKNKSGVANAIVSFGKGTALVTYDPGQIDLQDILKIIEKLGYQAVRASESGADFDKPSGLRQLAGIFIVLIALFYVFSRFGGFRIFDYFPQAKAGMGYGMLFVIGLLTSVHCTAMCGGINLSQCVPYRAASGGSERGSVSGRRSGTAGRTNGVSVLRPSILYNTGRVISYTVIGGLVGALGSAVSLSPAGKGVIAILAGVFMVIMGLNMMNFFPWLRRLNPRMPKVFAEKINERKKSGRPFYVGLLNGLMPCGPLQAMQLYALSTGDPFKGALSMLLFSLGTVPLMFGLGALSTVLTKRFTSKMMAVSAALVVILGVLMLGNGMALTGYALPFSSEAAGQTVSSASTSSPSSPSLSSSGSQAAGVNAELKDGVQEVTTKLSPNGYEPIVVQKGILVRWNIQADAEDITGCNSTVVISQYNLQKQLEPGDNIIEFTPAKSGVVPYSCGMGMIRSRITVVDDLKDPSSIPQNVESVESDESSLPSCCSPANSSLPSCCGD